MTLSDIIEGLQMQILDSVVYVNPLTDSELITLAECIPNNNSMSSLSLNISQLTESGLNMLKNALSDNFSVVTVNWQSCVLPIGYESSFQKICSRNQVAAMSLAKACEEGDLAKIESLLKRGVSVYTVPGPCQQPIIHQITATGNSAIFKLIFELRPMLDLDFSKGASSSILINLTKITKDWLPPLLGEFAYKQGISWERADKLQQAVICYQLGAEKKYPRAQLQLGLYHIKGWGGLPCDLKKAHFYLKLAAEANIDRAKRNLAKLESEHPELNNPDSIQPIFLDPPSVDFIVEEKKDLVYDPLISSLSDEQLISFDPILSFSNDASFSSGLRELIRSELELMHEKLLQDSQSSRINIYSQNQKQFNQIVRSKLEQLLIGAMAVASGRVKSKVGLLPNVIQGGIQLLGSVLPVPGSSLLSFLFKKGVQRSAVKERDCEAKQLTSYTMSLMDWVKAVETVAQQLTSIYAEQLNQLSSIKEKVIIQSLPWRQSQVALAYDSPETAIEFVADYAVLCMLKAMLAEKIQAETLVADLVHSVTYPEAMNSRISVLDSIKEAFDDSPILSTQLLTIHNQVWQLEEIFVKPGIKVLNDFDDSCEYYAGDEHQPALYGYRSGTVTETKMHPEWRKYFTPCERASTSESTDTVGSAISESSSSRSTISSSSFLSQSSSNSPQILRASSAQDSFFKAPSSTLLTDVSANGSSVSIDSIPVSSNFRSVLKDYEISTQQWVVSLYRKHKGQNPDHPYILIEALDMAKRVSLYRYDLQAVGQMAHVRRMVAKDLPLNSDDVWATFFEQFAIREQVCGVSWSVSWEVAMRLIQALNDMVEQHIQIAYGLRGSYSKLSSRAESVENCYTWARNKLIEHLGQSTVEALLPITWHDWIIPTARTHIKSISMGGYK